MLRYLILLPLLLVLQIHSIFAMSRASMVFLAMPVSPLANGFAGILLPLEMDDPLAPILNPAAVGMLAQEHSIAGAFYPARTEWGPETFHDFGIGYSARALNVGANQQAFGKWLGHATNFSVGVGYNEILFDLGETVRVGPNNEPLGTYHSRERMNGISVGIGYENRIRCGLGVTFKYVDSQLGSHNASTVTHDLGGVVEYPLLQYLHMSHTSSRFITPVLTPLVSYAITNIGGSADYTGEVGRADPLPRTEHVAFAFSSGIVMHDSANQNWTLAALEMGIQSEDELILPGEGSDFTYQSPFSDINIFRDILFGRANDRITKRSGYSISLFEVFSINRGSYNSGFENIRYTSKGFSIRLSGILKFAEFNGASVWSDRFDVAYSESQFSQSVNEEGWIPVFDGMRYHQLSLYIR